MRAMKDSGVEWIGRIPEEWGIKKLSSLFDEVTKKVSDKDYPPLSVTKQGILPQIDGVAKTDNGDNRKLVRIGDFVINSRSDRKGSSGVSEYEGSVSLINIVFQPKESVDMRYMHHLLRCYGFQEEFYRWGHGIVADLWTTNSSDAKNIILPTPSYEEQASISCDLDTKCAEIDKVVEQTRTTIEEYKKLKQAIITEAVTKGVRGPRPMKPSGVEWIGDIPEEWAISTLGKVTLSMRNGYVGPTRDLFVDDGVRYIQSLHIKDGKIDLSKKEYYVRPAWAAERPKVNTGDILIVQTGDIGQVGLVTDEHNECSCHALIIATPDKSTISSEYLTYFLRSTVGRELLLAHKTGALLPHLNSGKIRFAEVVYPGTVGEQQEIAAYLDTKCAEIDRIIGKKEQLIEELGRYKKSLIYEYVTGKKQVLYQ